MRISNIGRRVGVVFFSSLLFLTGIFSDVFAEILHVSDFETGQIQPRGVSHDGWRQLIFDKSRPRTDSILVQSNIVRAGKYSVRFHMERGWNFKGIGKKKGRVDMAFPSGASELHLDKEYWIGTSFYLPEDWVDDYKRNGEILWQFHGYKVSCSGNAIGGPAIGLYLREATMEVVIRWDSRIPCSVKPTQNPEGVKTLWFGSVEKGKWIDWVIHVRPSYGSNGLLEIWKGKEKIITYSGPNSLRNGERGMYFMIDDYKWGWRSQETRAMSRTIYHDEIRVGDANSSYGEVAPDRADIKKTAP